jgi:hypothetical protein
MTLAWPPVVLLAAPGVARGDGGVPAFAGAVPFVGVVDVGARVVGNLLFDAYVGAFGETFGSGPGVGLVTAAGGTELVGELVGGPALFVAGDIGAMLGVVMLVGALVGAFTGGSGLRCSGGGAPVIGGVIGPCEPPFVAGVTVGFGGRNSVPLCGVGVLTWTGCVGGVTTGGGGVLMRTG